jgi:hypothetical protein
MHWAVLFYSSFLFTTVLILYAAVLQLLDCNTCYLVFSLAWFWFPLYFVILFGNPYYMAVVCTCWFNYHPLIELAQI